MGKMLFEMWDEVVRVTEKKGLHNLNKYKTIGISP